MKAPEFWNMKRDQLDWIARLLTPIGWLVYCIGKRRFYGKKGYTGKTPVICVGNVTVGGAGKTPLCAYLGKLFMQAGKRACFVTRGYGGSLKGPVLVRPDRHTYQEVGDEALLLSAYASVIVAKNRTEGAQSADSSGAQIIICDDALQNHSSLHRDLVLTVIDCDVGFSNGRLLPAGPLREPIQAAFAKTDAIILTSAGKFDPPEEVRSSGLPIFHAVRTPVKHGYDLEGAAVIAFAGIARPERFFQTVKELGATIIKSISFSDHQPYEKRMIERLIREAEVKEALLVTTEKDMVRIPDEYRIYFTPVMIEFSFSEADETQMIGLISRKTGIKL